MNFIENISSFQNIIYIASSILFITGIKMLGKEDTAVKGNFLSAFAMFIAVSITLINVINPLLILIGIGIGAIIGSLIAGLTVDNLLKQNPIFDVMVYEKEKILSLEEGYGIQLAPNSVSILKKLDYPA